MKRLLLLIALAAMLGPNVGCCLMDRVACCLGPNGCGPNGCGPGGCGPAGCSAPGCGPLGGGGCFNGGGHGPGPGYYYGGGAMAGCGPGPGPGCGPGGPPSAQVTYPYYTVRGPRDFFACDPGYPRN